MKRKNFIWVSGVKGGVKGLILGLKECGNGLVGVFRKKLKS